MLRLRMGNMQSLHAERVFGTFVAQATVLDKCREGLGSEVRLAAAEPHTPQPTGAPDAAESLELSNEMITEQSRVSPAAAGPPRQRLRAALDACGQRTAPAALAPSPPARAPALTDLAAQPPPAHAT